MEAAIHHIQSVVAIASDSSSQNNGQLVQTLTIVPNELQAVEEAKVLTSADLARLLECGDCV